MCIKLSTSQIWPGAVFPLKWISRESVWFSDGTENTGLGRKKDFSNFQSDLLEIGGQTKSAEIQREKP